LTTTRRQHRARERGEMGGGVWGEEGEGMGGVERGRGEKWEKGFMVVGDGNREKSL